MLFRSKKKSTKKESTTIKRKVAKEALTPMGIVRDKSVLQTSVPPEQREPRVYNPDGKVLVIVESPAKSKTIEKFLGPNYVVKASMGSIKAISTLLLPYHRSWYDRPPSWYSGFYGIQFMQSYGKYNNVQKFFSFFVDYRM